MVKKKITKKTATTSKNSSSKMSMVKKGVENIWNKISPSFFNILETHMHNIFDWATKISNIRYHVRKFFFTYAFIIAGAIIFLLGISTYLNTLVNWGAGLMHIVIGAIVLLFALLISRA